MRRQVLWGVLAVAAVTLAAGLIAGTAIRRNLVEDRQTELARQAQATATLIAASVRDNFPANDRNDSIPVARTLEIARAIGGYDYVETQVVGVAASRAIAFDLPDTPMLDNLGPNPPVNEVVEVAVNDSLVFAYIRSVPLGLRSDTKLVVAIGTAEPLLATNLLTRPLLFSLGSGAVLAIFLAAWLARHVGRRLELVSAASQRIADGDFTARAPSTGDDDVARLGSAFNEMVDRLDDGRRRERDFLMSVGHDLRTPLTTLRGYAEALDAGEIETEDLARVGGVLRRQTDRLSRLIEPIDHLIKG